jgi:hypothetical protein
MSEHLDAYKTTGSSPPTQITLTRIDLVPGCTIGTGVGLDAEGNEVTFAADWRPCLALAEVLESGRTVEVTLADWQIICWDSRRPS